MELIYSIYAMSIASIYIVLYAKTYKKYFTLHKLYYFGVILLILSVYIQYTLIQFININIGYLALLSFITYPISFSFIYKTNIFNKLFLSFNIIVKIYITFLFFGTLYASFEGINYDPIWIKSTPYFALSQGNAYLISIGSLFLADHLLLKDKLKDFFLLKRNLLLLIGIQFILLINMAWLSFTDISVDLRWYNNMLLITSFSFEIIYFLLRLFTANSSYFSSYKVHTYLLEKQLDIQLEHYKNYEEQMLSFKAFKHDNDKVLYSISQLVNLKSYDQIETILNDYKEEISEIENSRKNYSNNFMLDALFNDYAKRFNRLNVDFSANTYIKLGYISDLKLIKLFYNILENAYEALEKVEVHQRRFTIDSQILESYIKISFVNSTSNALTNNLQTTKSDKVNHGFGSLIIHDILLEYDGFSKTYLNTTDGILYFHLEIYLPIE